MSKTFSDRELGLTGKWFTGAQWASGEAERANRKEYNDLVAANSEETKSEEPDWGGHCEVCGQSPIVPSTGMCGPCTFGESDTIGGNW